MTRLRSLLLSGLLLAAVTRPALAAEPPLRLWYEKPAATWVEALPIGNGRLGAMVFGDPLRERLALNEDTLWSGGPTSWNNPDAKTWLPKVREAVFAGRYAEADALTKKMQGPYNQSYQPLGDLLVDFDVAGPVEGYRRELDLDRAVATTSFRAGGALHTREVFASFPDQVIVLRVSADRPGRVSFTARMTSRLRHATAAEGTDGIALRGRAPSHVDPSYLGDTKEPVRYDEGPGAEGMRFTAIVRAIVRGGTTRTTPEGRLEVRGADEAVLLVSAGTSFNGFDKSPGREGRDPDEAARRPLATAAAKPFPALRDAHVADHAHLFGRVRLDLGAPAADRPTDERLRAYRHGEDPALVALVFQYGRYLLVASSRPGSQPANLQGLWNEDVRPPWSANWTMNINSEMNYWPAEVDEPLRVPRADAADDRRARAQRPRDRADQLRRAGLGGPPQRRPLAADRPRRELGPGRPEVGQLADGCRLALDGPVGALRVHARRRLAARRSPGRSSGARPSSRSTGSSRTGRAASPPRRRSRRRTSSAPPTAPGPRSRRPTTSDLALLRELFANAIEASTILDVDAALRREMEGALARLPPYRVGARGQLQEWSEDFEEPEPHHRHSRTSSASIPGAASRPRRRPRSRQRCGARWSCGATTARAGRWPGR